MTETPTRSGTRRRGLLAAAAFLLVVAAAWVAERQIAGSASGDDGPPVSVYSVVVTRDGELLRTFAVADLEALPTVSITAEGKAQEGPSLLAVDRDGPVPAPGDTVRHDDWLRPRLWAGVPVVPVQRDAAGGWFAVGPRTIDAAPPAPPRVTPSD